MKITKKQIIYISQNLNFKNQQYSNGYIFWLAGINTTLVRYLDTTKDMKLNMIKQNNNLIIKESNLNQTANFYKILKQKEQIKQKQYLMSIITQMKNALLNATVGISKYLILRGVGYKFINKFQYLSLQLGYSHKINITIPSHIKFKFNRKYTKIKFLSNSLNNLTNLLSFIRSFKKPDVYKGKGIRYRKDKIFYKEGKKKTF